MYTHLVTTAAFDTVSIAKAKGMPSTRSRQSHRRLAPQVGLAVPESLWPIGLPPSRNFALCF
eukprot:883849-Heterocapsa_arctica.AAC.1